MRATLLVLAVFAVAAVLAPFWTPWPVDGVDVANRFLGPSLAHPLGTDQLGRDVLSLLMAGATTSLGVAAAAVAIGVGLGAPLGLAAASLGGWGGGAIMRAGDVVFAFPALITAAVLATAYGPGSMNAVIAIGVFNIPVFARLTAAAARSVLAQDFCDAARLAGKDGVRIAAEHVAPNVAPVVATHVATQFAVALLGEAALSYVGLGAQPPVVSWGRMLADAQTLLPLAPMLAVWPGLAIAAAVFSATSLGEAFRRRLDPLVAR